MSWDLKAIRPSGNREEVRITSFSGGASAGRCLQLTQWVDTRGDGSEKQVQFVHLTKEQALELVNRIHDWDVGNVSEHDPHGKRTKAKFFQSWFK